MLIGYNNDVEYRNKVFHIQTEDRGLGNCKIETQIFHSGEILDTLITSYEKYTEEPDVELRNKRIQALMQASHRELYKRLLGGEYDEFAGLEPMADADRKKLLGGPAAPSEDFQPSQDGIPQGALAIEQGDAEMVAALQGRTPTGEQLDLSKLKNKLSRMHSEVSEVEEAPTQAVSVDNLKDALSFDKRTPAAAEVHIATVDGARAWQGCEAPRDDLSVTDLVTQHLGLKG